MTDFSSLGTTDDDISQEFIGYVQNEKKERQTLNVANAKRVVKYAARMTKKLEASSDYQRLLETTIKPCELRHSQIELGRLLGQGSFSDVYEIKTTTARDIDQNKFVVKFLRDKMVDDLQLFTACAAGLAMESSILASLNHDNIIQMKGWSHGRLYGYSTGRHDAFFIVLDRLDMMLTERMTNWRHQAEKLRYCVRHRSKKNDEFLLHRIQVAKDLAGAIAYIHSRRIVHRDLKPSNIGFQGGTLKVFDFDVSRFLPKEEVCDQMFNLTARTGTRRYMSPECGLGKPYNSKTDVYTFALILYEIISLQKAYPCLNKEMHERQVFFEGRRPPIHHLQPKCIRIVLQHAWSEDIHHRPPMAQIRELLSELNCAMIHRLTSPARRIGFRHPQLPRFLASAMA